MEHVCIPTYMPIVMVPRVYLHTYMPIVMVPRVCTYVCAYLPTYVHTYIYAHSDGTSHMYKACDVYGLSCAENRSVGETQMNERSSRSHTIFTLNVESRHSSSAEDDAVVKVAALVSLVVNLPLVQCSIPIPPSGPVQHPHTSLWSSAASPYLLLVQCSIPIPPSGPVQHPHTSLWSSAASPYLPLVQCSIPIPPSGPVQHPHTSLWSSAASPYLPLVQCSIPIPPSGPVQHPHTSLWSSAACVFK